MVFIHWERVVRARGVFGELRGGLVAGRVGIMG
jgi:hypothetical protein